MNFKINTPSKELEDIQRGSVLYGRCHKGSIGNITNSLFIVTYTTVGKVYASSGMLVNLSNGEAIIMDGTGFYSNHTSSAEFSRLVSNWIQNNFSLIKIFAKNELTITE